MSNFPTKIRQLRIEKGLTQQQTAEALNVSQNAVHNWETGKREPSMDIINQFAKLFDFPIYLLLDNNYEIADREIEKASYYINLENGPNDKNGPQQIYLEDLPVSIENIKKAKKILQEYESDRKLAEDDIQELEIYVQQETQFLKRLTAYLKYFNKLQFAYSQLNETGKKEAVKRVEELTEIPRYSGCNPDQAKPAQE